VEFIWPGQGNNPQLALEMSDIYAWTIDFFGIQRGDNFKVIYEELYVEDQPIGVGKSAGSVFENARNEFYAFYYVQDSVGDFFDEQANSLRKTFLKAPTSIFTNFISLFA
jgi:hypothetical protein